MNYRFLWAGICLLALFCGLTGTVQAQDELKTSSKKAKKAFIRAQKEETDRLWNNAILSYTDAVNADSNFAQAHYRLGNLLFLNNDRYRRAGIGHLQTFIAKDPENPLVADVALRVSRFFLDSGQYQESQVYLDKINPDQLSNTGFKEEFKLYRTKIDFALAQLKKSKKLDIVELPATVNSNPLQYSPSLNGDGTLMIFTARTGIGAAYDENIFESEFVNGQWQQCKPVKGKINTRDNEGSASISADGRVMVFTGCDRPGGLGSCDLYVSYKDGDSWSQPNNISEVNSGAWESQPSLNADGTELYFVSNRKGGLGGYDLYVSTRSGARGQFGDPVNMGVGINTEKDEFTPFIHANNTTLFYASNGLPGMGGLDLFYCYKTPLGFSPPLNLGHPVNSHLQETGLVISPNGKSAFFNEEVRGKKDSKSVKIKTFPIPSDWTINPATTYVKGRVYDAETKASISASIQVVDLAQNNSTYRVKSDPFSGKYLAVINAGKTYGLFVAEPGYLYKSLTFNVEKEDSLKPKEVDIPLEKVKKGSRTTMTNLYFDTKKWDLRNESLAELDNLYQFMEINQAVSITVEGHTDDVGPDKDNLILSQKRAASVQTYLESKGIESKRIKTVGYGETKPLVKTGGAQQINRRIEFVIN